MRQRELAKRVNIDPAHLSRVLNFKKMPRVDLAIRIARALNKSVEDIWGNQVADKRETQSNEPCQAAS